MKTLHPRLLLRLVLGLLTRLVLRKHSPDIIVVSGDGQTSIVREAIYTLLYENHPARRNLEAPESEFSIPLTVFGEFSYPKSSFSWIILIIKIVAQLVRLKPYKHVLILEISRLNREVYDFWVHILNPKFIIEVPKNLDFTAKKLIPSSLLVTINDVMNYYKIEESYFYLQIEKLNLPTSRIKILKGPNKSLIIDARHYFYPTPLASVIEISSTLSGRKVIFTDEKDIENVIKLGFLINPKNFKPTKNDTIIVRGQKTKTKLLF